MLRSSFVSAVLGSIALVAGCGGGGAPAGKCGEAECKSFCASSAAPAPAKATGGGEGMSAFERQLLDPMLADVRAGIRPFSEQSVGVCRGQAKECEEWLGTDVAELPPGKYMLRAELRVPKAGDSWKVRLDTSCETTKKTKSGETKNTQTNSKEYEVKYLGEERGYRLSPLFTIDSPSTSGARACTWKLVLQHPDGDKTVEGKWAVPDAEAK